MKPLYPCSDQPILRLMSFSVECVSSPKTSCSGEKESSTLRNSIRSAAIRPPGIISNTLCVYPTQILEQHHPKL
jgi:hypothetical protein